MSPLEKREAIASLPGHLGYQALLETMEGIVEDAVILTVNADTEAATLKAARNLQALFKYHNVLKTIPQNIQAEFEDERRLINEMGDDPLMTISRRQLLQEIEANFDARTGAPKRGKK
jgi:hypothetical protein